MGKHLLQNVISVKSSIYRIELYLQKNPNPEKVADDQKNDLNNNIAEIKNVKLTNYSYFPSILRNLRSFK